MNAATAMMVRMRTLLFKLGFLGGWVFAIDFTFYAGFIPRCVGEPFRVRRKCRLQKGSYLRLLRIKAIQQIQHGGADAHQNAACVAAGFLNNALFFQLDVGDLALVGLD